MPRFRIGRSKKWLVYLGTFSHFFETGTHAPSISSVPIVRQRWRLRRPASIPVVGRPGDNAMEVGGQRRLTGDFESYPSRVSDSVDGAPECREKFILSKGHTHGFTERDLHVFRQEIVCNGLTENRLISSIEDRCFLGDVEVTEVF